MAIEERGQAQSQNKSKTYCLSLTKDELHAVRFALRADYEIVANNTDNEPGWEQDRMIIGGVLDKISLLDDPLKDL